jgi:glycine dehydrogenase subunit 2
MPEPLIYDLSSPGRVGITLPDSDVPAAKLPDGLVREDLPLPELSEMEVVRNLTTVSISASIHSVPAQ